MQNLIIFESFEGPRKWITCDKWLLLFGRLRISIYLFMHPSVAYNVWAAYKFTFRVAPNWNENTKKYHMRCYIKIKREKKISGMECFWCLLDDFLCTHSFVLHVGFGFDSVNCCVYSYLHKFNTTPNGIGNVMCLFGRVCDDSVSRQITVFLLIGLVDASVSVYFFFIHAYCKRKEISIYDRNVCFDIFIERQKRNRIIR